VTPPSQSLTVTDTATASLNASAQITIQAPPAPLFPLPPLPPAAGP